MLYFVESQTLPSCPDPLCTIHTVRRARGKWEGFSQAWHTWFFICENCHFCPFMCDKGGGRGKNQTYFMNVPLNCPQYVFWHGYCLEMKLFLKKTIEGRDVGCPILSLHMVFYVGDLNCFLQMLQQVLCKLQPNHQFLFEILQTF